MKIILFSIGILTVIATLLPLIPRDDWWIRGFDFPRLQITAVILATLAALLLTDTNSRGVQILIVALFLCLFYQIYMISPYTLLAKPQVQQSEYQKSVTSLSILCANVQMNNRKSSKFKQIIRESDPDIILVLEPDEWWINGLKEFEQKYPYMVKQPQDNLYGMALYSRLELVDPQVKFLVQDDIPSIFARVKLRSGNEIELRCLHPRPPFPTEIDQSTERDAELLIVGKQIKDLHGPTVVMGDLNDVAWSRTNYLFQDISGLLDPRVGRGFYNTFHAKYPFVRFPLDHCFHSKHFRLIDFKRLDYFGSDHFPVYIELSFEPDASLVQKELQADESEEKEAEEKIANAT